MSLFFNYLNETFKPTGNERSSLKRARRRSELHVKLRHLKRL